MQPFVIIWDILHLARISLRFVLIRMQLIQGNGINSRKLKMIRLMCFMQDLCRQMGIIRRQSMLH